jgi:hypothetical protein
MNSDSRWEPLLIIFISSGCQLEPLLIFFNTIYIPSRHLYSFPNLSISPPTIYHHLFAFDDDRFLKLLTACLSASDDGRAESASPPQALAPLPPHCDVHTVARLLKLRCHHRYLVIPVVSPQARCHVPLCLLAIGLRIEKLHIFSLFSLLGYCDMYWFN